LESIDSLLAVNKYLFPEAKHVEGGARGTNLMWRELKAGKEWPPSTLLPGGIIPVVYLHQISFLGK